MLIVEDEEPIRILSEIILMREGYSVLSASGPNEALKILGSSQTIDLLLTDLAMPELSGHDLAARAIELKPGIKIIIATGSFGQAPTPLSERQRRDALIKPFTPEQLIIAVNKVLTEPVNWTTTKTPLWELDCENFLRAKKIFEVREVSKPENEEFIRAFCERSKIGCYRRGASVVYLPEQVNGRCCL